jgi:hypothetical protein
LEYYSYRDLKNDGLMQMSLDFDRMFQNFSLEEDFHEARLGALPLKIKSFLSFQMHQAF